MASRMSGPFLALCMLCAYSTVGAFDSDIISDITSSAADERRALEIKASEFWQPVLLAAEQAKLEEHLAVYEQVESAIAALPSDLCDVRGWLSQALTHLRRADENLMLQGVSSSELASERLAARPVDDGPFSFLTGGQNLFSLAIKRFVGGGQYSERLVNHLRRRQADILPALRGAAEATGSVLSDCRSASKLGFDVLKHDLYDVGAARTPSAAKDAADSLIKAAGETRHRFMALVTGAVNSLAKDSRERHDDPSATVTRSLLSGMQESLKTASVQNDAQWAVRLV
eukprot:TRINITY_DN2458_c0_g1_i1.p1 TRINITY_DN2458_c0_g1~~TRINITY_DN2458_c0_g1_i1.p1  ORF type:complete len:286 (+),score=58.76 TRINITY_DN2458_c0_g1_i1:91-948(+)